MAGSLPDSSISWIKTLSILCPPSNVSICILDNYMVFPVSPKQHQRKQNKLCSVNRDPESLNPWRPDCIYLVSCSLIQLSYLSLVLPHFSSLPHQFSSPSIQLEIHLFMFLITC
ncbi:hypothetical protein ILYODFUR_033744 [Ilyodon furcidens]|uniref:Uncharacterized protein n=1 Tax=Ilyodon furcidens TaxID=33524 RepID=A0ABV0SRF4_9TELE